MANDLIPLLERLYEEVKGTPRDIRPDDRLGDDLGLDSLAASELLTTLEDELGISLVDDARVADVETVADVLEIVTNALPGRPRS